MTNSSNLAKKYEDLAEERKEMVVLQLQTLKAKKKAREEKHVKGMEEMKRKIARDEELELRNIQLAIINLIYILGKELQTKWKSLRDQFIKAKKLERDIKRGASAGKKKTYIYYDQLQFLIHSDESHETVTNLSPDRDILARQMKEVIANIEEGSDSFRAPTPTPTVPIPHTSTSTPKTRKRKIQKDDDDGVRAIINILRQSVELQRQEKDADRMGNKAFLASILPFLDKMSDEVVMEAR
ncbi:Alcohol dehydrogenase transcription factor Myb/SANT-like, partial [Popillia japonica]